MFSIKNLFLILILVGFGLQGFCQDSTAFKAKNAVYLETFGNSPNYTINYDRLLWSKNNFHLGARVGVGAWYLRYYNSNYYTAKPTMLTWNLPVEFYALYGKDKHFIESSVGCTYSTAKYLIEPPNFGDELHIVERFRNYFVARLGYRRQSKNGGFMYRVGATMSYNTNPWGPSLSPYEYSTWFLFGGINLGWNF